jgi:hypothetical protein
MITRIANDLAIRVLVATRNALLLLLVVVAALTPVSAGRGVDVPGDGKPVARRRPVRLARTAKSHRVSIQNKLGRPCSVRSEPRLSSRRQGRSGARRSPR